MSQPFFFVYFHFFFFIAIVFVVLLLLLLISLLLIYFSIISFFFLSVSFGFFFDIFLLFYFDLFLGSTDSSEKIVSLLMYMQLYSFKYWSSLSLESKVNFSLRFVVPVWAILSYFGVRVGPEINFRFLLCRLKAFIF